LIKDGPDKHCAFQDASGKCNIFSSRPFQCITGPFLDNFTHSYLSWRDWKKVCPASRAKLNKGKFYSIEEISSGIKQEREIVSRWRNGMLEHDNNYLEYLNSL
jgi:Fe-S-cluster containining protein